jgi:hypothetical protein
VASVDRDAKRTPFLRRIAYVLGNEATGGLDLGAIEHLAVGLLDDAILLLLRFRRLSLGEET